MSFSARLIWAFVLTSAMTALISALILAFVWGGQFRSYTDSNVQSVVSATASRLAQSYEQDGTLTNDALSRASLATTMYPNLGVRVRDVSGRVVYDNTSELTAPEGDDSLEEVASAQIVADRATVGTVSVWTYDGSQELSQADESFRRRSYQAIVFAALIATALAAIVGFVASRGVMASVNRVTEAAKKVKGGDLTARTGMVGDDEVSQLGETFDAMADSIQRDRELERRLTADVAHELRTPLMGIQATVEAIIDGVLPADQERLAAINSETTRLKRLVEALLRLSRYESGSVPFNERPVDITELISGLFMSHEALLDDAGITHAFICDDEAVVVDGDADMIRQATSNLISNAVRYNSEGGDVTVEVHRVGNMGVISVSDTGIGIAPEDLNKVFSRFWRADEGRTRASGGLGVGLAVVKEIADYHNGSVEVESELGKGTTFRLLLPAHEDVPARSSKGLTSIIRRPQGTSSRSRQRAEKQEANRQKKRREKDAKQARQAAGRAAGSARKEQKAGSAAKGSAGWRGRSLSATERGGTNRRRFAIQSSTSKVRKRSSSAKDGGGAYVWRKNKRPDGDHAKEGHASGSSDETAGRGETSDS